MSCSDYEDLLRIALDKLDNGYNNIDQVRALRKLYNSEIQISNNRDHKQKLLAFDRRLQNYENIATNKKILERGDLENQIKNDDDFLKETEGIQNKTSKVLKNTIKIANETRSLGQEIVESLNNQQEQIIRITNTVQDVSTGLSRSKRILNDIARRMASDKLLICLIFIFIAVIIAVIAVVSTKN